MKLNILLKTDDYRGDHSKDVSLAFDCDPSLETVEELCQRIFDTKTHAYRPFDRKNEPRYQDWIEIRMIQETKEPRPVEPQGGKDET